VLTRRRRLGLDTHDEVWDGDLHVNPAAHARHGLVQAQVQRFFGECAPEAELRAIAEFNLGDEADFRVPDAGLLRPAPGRLYHSTAALVLEVVSPGDETWDKLDFYAAHGVDELLIVDPLKRTVEWLGLRDGRYEPIERSALIDLGGAELAERLDWPED
jgi:hypothetical protein